MTMTLDEPVDLYDDGSFDALQTEAHRRQHSLRPGVGEGGARRERKLAQQRGDLARQRDRA